MLLNVAAHNVTKHECHITYSVTKHTASQKVKCTLHMRYTTFCNGIHFVTLYVLWRLHNLELLRCVKLRFVTLCHVTFPLCCFTLCSNILLNTFISQVDCFWSQWLAKLPILVKCFPSDTNYGSEKCVRTHLEMCMLEGAWGGGVLRTLICLSLYI